MSQSSFLFAVLLVAFVLFLATNDRLRTYLGVLWGNTAAPKPSGGPSTSSGSIAGVPIQDIISAGQIAVAAGGA